MHKKICDRPPQPKRIAKRGLRSKHIPDTITLDEAKNLDSCPNCSYNRFRYRKFTVGEMYHTISTSSWSYTISCDTCGYLIGKTLKEDQTNQI